MKILTCSIPLILFVGVVHGAGWTIDGRDSYQYRNLMPAYWKVATTNIVGAERVKQFRISVVSPNLAVFQAAAGSWLSDTNLADFVHLLDGKSEQLREVDRRFPDRFRESWRRFEAQVPGLQKGAAVFLIPAPRAAVGGAVRPLGTQNALIFGAEEISTVIDSQVAFDVLVQHEMTHLYQMQVNPEIRRMIAEVYMPPYATDRAKLYQVLWLEGLAAYESKALNPTATDQQVLLSGTVASEVRAIWPTLRADLSNHLDSSNKEDIDAYMFDASSKIPRRAGYYIGMLIAQRLALQHTFAELCQLQGQQLRAEVAKALLEMPRVAGSVAASGQ
jgi:hypothetical protein